MNTPWRNFCDILPEALPVGILRHLDNIGHFKIVGAWRYSDNVLKCRYENAAGEKTCRWCSKTASGWQCRLPDGYIPPLYGVDSITDGCPVLVCEGEKAAASIHRLGLAAVGLAGTSYAKHVDLSPLAGHSLILWPDNDIPGQAAIEEISTRLDRPHKRVDPQELGLPEKGDAADLVAGLILNWDDHKGWDGTTPFPRNPGDDFHEMVMERIAPALVDITPDLHWKKLPDDWLTVDIPPRDFVFSDTVPVGCVTLLLAAGGSGKSMLALTLALSVATGRELVQGFTPTKPDRVVVVSLEDDMPEIHRRLQRIARFYGVSPEDANSAQERLQFMPVATFKMLEVENGSLLPGKDLTSLQRKLTEIQPRLIILDPLAALLGGAVDENDNAAAQAVVGMIREAMPTDAGILVAAHVSKAERELSVTARGASAWMDAARTVFAIRCLDKKELSIVKNDNHYYVALELRKSNYAPMRPPLYLRRESNPITAGVLSVIDFGATRAQAQAEQENSVRAAVPEILASLDAEGVTKQEAVGHGQKGEGKSRGASFRDALSDAVGFTVSCELMKTTINKMLKEGTLLQITKEKRKVLALKTEANPSCDGVMPECSDNE